MSEDREDRRATSRLCALTRVARPISELIRLTADPAGRIVADIRNRLPGRGVWITNDRKILGDAIRRKIFSRALKSPVTVPDDFESQVGELLRRDALQMLAIANKAGAVTAGFAKIEGMKGPLLALIQASDGSESEIARLQGLCRARARGQTDPAAIRIFSASEIGLSLGREHVIHAALAVHHAGAAFLDRARRYVEFMSGGPAERDASESGPSGVFQVPPEIDRA